MMRFEGIIALRYLRSKRQVGAVTVISIISIVGVMIGVAALLVVLSVFNGFSGLVTSILVNFDPHLRIESPTRTTMATYESLSRFLSSNTEVKAFSPFVSGKAVVISRNANRVINLRGIDVQAIGSVMGLKEKLVLGSLPTDDESQNGIVLGMTLADRLGAVVEDTITVVSPAGTELALMQMGQPLVRRFQVLGIYESNNKEYDSYYAYVSLKAGQRFFQYGDDVSGLDVRLANIDRATVLKNQLVKQFGAAFRILTWYDLHRDLYSVMKVERWMAYIILSMIIGVASFNLLGSLTMSVIEKTRDVGVLKTMGATDKSIVRIFFFEGIFVGVVGTVLGLLLGFLLIVLQKEYHLFPLDPTVYIIPAIPVDVRLSDVIVIVITAIGFCSLAALYPSKRAAQLLPVEAIRWE